LKLLIGTEIKDGRDRSKGRFLEGIRLRTNIDEVLTWDEFLTSQSLNIEVKPLAITQPSQALESVTAETLTVQGCDGCDDLESNVKTSVTAETLAVQSCDGCDGQITNFTLEKTKNKKETSVTQAQPDYKIGDRIRFKTNLVKPYGQIISGKIVQIEHIADKTNLTVSCIDESGNNDFDFIPWGNVIEKLGVVSG
jgi:hypothetical protein